MADRSDFDRGTAWAKRFLKSFRRALDECDFEGALALTRPFHVAGQLSVLRGERENVMRTLSHVREAHALLLEDDAEAHSRAWGEGWAAAEVWGPTRRLRRPAPTASRFS